MRNRGVKLVAMLLVLTLALPMTASAETITQLKTRLEVLKKRSATAGRAFDNAYWELDETEVALQTTQKRLKSTEKKLAAARRRLNKRASNIYRRDPLEMVEFLVGSRSFDQLVQRAEFMSRIGTADARAVAQVKRLRRDLVMQRNTLVAERKTRAAKVRQLKRERDRLQAKLRAANAEFRQVKRRLDAARGGLTSGVSSAPGPNGMVFPVFGSYYYANTWGASRSGGRRRHQGTDIMAPSGTPCVAILSGTVTTKTGGLGGRVTWLRADNGWLFYYAHLKSWTVRSGRVRAGQVIGYVGATGNASGGAPHLHFQMHPGGGGPVNPYPYLRGME